MSDETPTQFVGRFLGIGGDAISFDPCLKPLPPTPRDEPGYRWLVLWCWDRPSPDLDKCTSTGPMVGLTLNGKPIEFGDPTEFLVVGFDDDDYERPLGRFTILSEAEAMRDRLNRADAEATLDPAFGDRRKRLRRLGETFSVRYGEGGHPDTRWPSQPGRYAVCEWSERYSESFWDTVETRDEVEARILDGDATRVVDLDTGDEIPFVLSVALGVSGDERGDA